MYTVILTADYIFDVIWGNLLKAKLLKNYLLSYSIAITLRTLHGLILFLSTTLSILFQFYKQA